MNSTTLDAAPRTLTSRGAASTAGTATSRPNLVGNIMLSQLTERANKGNYPAWLDHVQSAAGCSRPIRLDGQIYTVERRADTATVLSTTMTAGMPDGVIYKACGNRRASVCPSCARTYQADAYQLLRAGLVGGKGIPAGVTRHPAVFATFTAPSFGTVHTRNVKRHTCANHKTCDCRPDPCHARRGNPACAHGQPVACFARHDAADTQLGRPLCLDCYDHEQQVVWNVFAGELWRRTKQSIERHLSRLARRRGIPRVLVGFTPTGKPVTVSPVRVSVGKVAEFQRRGVIHFHALVRLDGVDADDPGSVVPPPPAFTVADLDDAIRAAAVAAGFDTSPHPDQPAGWHLAWGEQLDIRLITLSGDGEITDGKAAGYLAKYATKSTEATGHRSTRITHDNVDDYADADGDHNARLIAACWRLGRPTRTPVPLSDRPGEPRPKPGFRDPWTCQHCRRTTRLAACLCQDTSPTASRPDPTLVDDADESAGPVDPYSRLRRWAHMLGFGGHFLTKSRRYSVTFAQLRETRSTWRRHEHDDPVLNAEPLDQAAETILIVGSLTFAGVGWHTSADAMLANSAAAMAREKAAIGREEIAHQIGAAHALPHPLEQQ